MRIDKVKNNNEAVELDTAASKYFKNKSEQNLTEVVEKSGKLISYFIKLYGCGQSRDDLYQAAVEGLLKALKRYQHSSGVSFSTYAGHCIMGEIRHYVRREISYYRPRVMKELQEDIEGLIKKEMDVSGSLPELGSIAERVNIKTEGINEVMRSGLVPLEELELSRVSNQRLESFKLPIEDRLVLAQALDKLTELQKKVVYQLFFCEMSQEQTAAKLHLNQRKVSRLKQSILSTLRSAM